MRTVLRHLGVGFQTVGMLVFLGIVSFVISLMVPIKAWRTGELPAEPLPLHPAKPFAAPPIKVWIDTDAACGQDRRTDPDDCFAILLLAQQDTVEIVGVSTVFGNAHLRETDRTKWLFGWLGFRGLFIVTGDQSQARAYATGSALYCPKVSEQFVDRLLNSAQGWLLSTNEKPMALEQPMAAR